MPLGATMELRRRLMGRSSSNDGDRKITIPSKSPPQSKSPSSSGHFSPGSNPARSLKNLFGRKKSRRETPSPESSVVDSRLSRQKDGTIRELTEVFNHFDADGDGKISSVELRAVMRSLGEDLTDKELKAMIVEVDSDGDGFISLTDFVRLNTEILDGLDAESELMEAFRMFDVGSEGCITPKGLHEILTRLGEKSSLDDCHLMIKRVDFDGDGVVSFPEFKQMMTA